MLTHNLGYPRIGSHRELKKACEQYWSGKTAMKNLFQVGRNLRLENWRLQQEAGIDLIPSNDFSFYDHVLDMSLMVGAIPHRYHEVILDKKHAELDLYFAMARGYQKDGLDITAMEMTKWFDTNYHYLVPEFHPDQQFKLFSTKIIDEYYEAREAGILTKPVLLGPVSYLLLGKEQEEGFDKIDLIKNILPVYIEIIQKLVTLNASWIQFDEPFLNMDLTDKERKAYRLVYAEIRRTFPSLKTIVTTYFGKLGDNLSLATSLPISALHIDLVRSPEQVTEVLDVIPDNMMLSMGLIDGRNIWKNDLSGSLKTIHKAVDRLGADRIMIAPSCSLLHTPCDLDLETNDRILTEEIKNWMAFAKQKIYETALLKRLSRPKISMDDQALLRANQKAIESKKTSERIHRPEVKKRTAGVTGDDARRKSNFQHRQQKQQSVLKLPLFPTTSIGSFPQTDEIRRWRAKFKSGTVTESEYIDFLRSETEKAIRWQEQVGLDVLVHGEFERNDMVEYFGEQLQGFVFSKNGWVQSYGSRCVKPPIIYGDVFRPEPMTVGWTTFAQSLTDKPMKGMLTGPVTILQWSFVRDDQPRNATCLQLALAIRDEVCDLEKAGIRIIQIDEPAIREGLPLRKQDWKKYLEWAVNAFRVASSGVDDETQIHTHMCYAEFNDIIQSIADLDADVITIETSRSQMELLDAFVEFKYPNEIGPGVYDIHSPRIPTTEEMVSLLIKATRVLPKRNIWVNPDCGLKTRKWPETDRAVKNMVQAAQQLRGVKEFTAV